MRAAAQPAGGASGLKGTDGGGGRGLLVVDVLGMSLFTFVPVSEPVSSGLLGITLTRMISESLEGVVDETDGTNEGLVGAAGG